VSIPAAFRHRDSNSDFRPILGIRLISKLHFYEFVEKSMNYILLKLRTKSLDLIDMPEKCNCYANEFDHFRNY
jgi:hypothetical protein